MGVKRSSTAATPATPATPAWKKLRGPTVKAKIATVTAALADTALPADAPEDARHMLAAGAATALAAFVEDRHPLQETIISMIKETLSDIATRLAGQTAEAKRAADGAVADMELQKAQVQVAVDDVEEARSALEAEASLLDNAAASAAAVKEELRQSEMEQKVQSKELQGMLTEQAKYRGLLEGDMKVLMEEGSNAGGSEKQSKKLCSRLLQSIKQLEPDLALLAAVPVALLKVREERQGFDHCVIDAVKVLLEGRLSALAAQLQACEQAVASLSADVTSKVLAAEEARALQERAGQAVKAAQAAQDDKKAAAAAAQFDLERAEGKVKELSHAVTEAEAEAEAFQEVLACMEFLGARSSAEASAAAVSAQHDESKLAAVPVPGHGAESDIALQESIPMDTVQVEVTAATTAA